MTRRAAPLAALALTLMVAAPAGAGHPFHRHHPRGTPPPGEPRRFEHTHARAGDPLRVSPRAAPTRTPAYSGYYVGGGGSAHGGDSRRPDEGTWGWDYEGLRLPRNVALGWNHGRRAQGGTGSYTTDRIEAPDSIGFVINGLRGRTREGPPEH